LQSITGKAIFAKLFRLIAWHWFIGSPIIVIDAPTLYETKHLLKFCSKVVVVAVHPKIQLERLIARDNCSETEAMNRIKSQIPIEEKAKLAEIVVWNDGSKEQIIENSHALAKTLRSEGRGLSVLFSAPGVAIVGAVLYAMFQILRVQHK
jgi:dephospho-CoA kinase